MKNNQQILIYFSLILGIFFAGCQKEEDFAESTQVETEQTLEELIQGIEDHMPEGYDIDAWKSETFRPNASPRGSKIVKIPNALTGEIESRTAQIIDDYVVLEGDIVLGTVADIDRQNRQLEGRGIVKDGFASRWEYGIIPYEDFSDHPRSEKIQDAMDEVAEKTNLSFVLRTNEDKYLQIYDSPDDDGNYVLLLGMPVASESAYANPELDGNRRPMFITDGASKGTIMHELLHVAGMKHEQSRCDRDDHVRIYTSNISSGNASQFDKHCDDFTDVYSYDYGSIMHYPPYGFSKNALPTIVPRTPWAHLFYPRFFQMGQRSGLSNTDISTVNHMYPIDKNRFHALLTLYPVPGTNVRLGVQASGNTLYLDQWRGWGAQRFQFIEATDGYYYIKSVENGMYITIPNASNLNDVVVELQNLASTHNQQFRMEPVNWGTYRIIARHSSKDIQTTNIIPGDILRQGPEKHTGQYTIVTL